MIPKRFNTLTHTLLISVLLLTAAIPAAATGLGLPDKGDIRVAFVLTDGATMIDFAGPWEVFQDVHVPDRGSTPAQIMPFKLYTVGKSRDPIRTSGGMRVVPDYTFDDAPTPHIVIIPAQRGSDELPAWLRQAHNEGAIVASVCTGAFKLADTGLLDGLAATTHHAFYKPFSERFPQIRLVRSTRFVEASPTLFTAGGLTSGIDLALHLVDRAFGREVAEATARYMEYQGSGWRH